MKPPRLMWFDGEIVPWGEARVHVYSEVAVRGASVFEGVRSYWHAGSSRSYVLFLDEHMARLRASAKILKYPSSPLVDEIPGAISRLLRDLEITEHAYIRPTVYLGDARGGGVGTRDVAVGAYVVVFPLPRAQTVLTGIRCMVSSWRRPSDLAVSPRIKAGSGFQSMRLPRIEAAEHDMDDVILLDERGSVAESTGANVFVIRNGEAVTPPVTSGILEGITRRHVIAILRDQLGLRTVEREIDRTELYVADEVFLCSTMHELQPVIEIDRYPIGDGGVGRVTAACRDHYIATCEAGPDAPPGWLTPA